MTATTHTGLPLSAGGLRPVRIALGRHRGVLATTVCVLAALLLFLVYAHMSYARSILTLIDGDVALPAAERAHMLQVPAQIVSPDSLAAHLLGFWCLTPLGAVLVVLAVAWISTADVRHRTDSVRASLRSRRRTSAADLFGGLAATWALVLLSVGLVSVLLHLTTAWWSRTGGGALALHPPTASALLLVLAHTALVAVTTILTCRLTGHATTGAAVALVLTLPAFMTAPGSLVGLLPWSVGRSLAAHVLTDGYGAAAEAFLFDTAGVVAAPTWAPWPPLLTLVIVVTLVFWHDRRKTVTWR